jgi:hypothetical protein
VTTPRPRAWNSTLPQRSAGLNPGKGFTNRGTGLSRSPAKKLSTSAAATMKLAEREKVRAIAPRRDTGPDQATRRAVYARDGYACVCCGTPVRNRPHSVGHRKRRSQGGGNGISNLLTFLGLGSDPGNPDDHHARIDHRRDPADKDKGYRVDSAEDPAVIPVQYFETSGSGFTANLGDDGSLRAEDGTVLYRPSEEWAA